MSQNDAVMENALRGLLTDQEIHVTILRLHKLAAFLQQVFAGNRPDVVVRAQW